MMRVSLSLIFWNVTIPWTASNMRHSRSITREKPHKNLKATHIHHNNAWHTYIATNQINKLRWSVLPQLPWSLDLVPSGFHLFSPIRMIFKKNNLVTQTVKLTVMECKPTFFQRGFHSLKCMLVMEIMLNSTLV